MINNVNSMVLDTDLKSVVFLAHTTDDIFPPPFQAMAIHVLTKMSVT